MFEQNEVELKILGADYRILCGVDDETNLRSIVESLEEKLLHIKKKYPHAPNEKIIMLHAINMMRKMQKLEERIVKFEDHAKTLNAKIDDGLNKGFKHSIK